MNYGERGDFKQAETYLRQALALQRRLHGNVHPDLAEAMNNLGWALMGLNQPVGAEPLYRLALEMKRRMLGDAHPELAAGLNNLAFVLETRRDFKGAEKAYREALAMNRKLLGDSHPDIAMTMSNLAFVLYQKGDHQAGIELLKGSLSMSRHELGSEHPDVAGTASDLAYLLTGEGADSEAEQLVDESLAIRRRCWVAIIRKWAAPSTSGRTCCSPPIASRKPGKRPRRRDEYSRSACRRITGKSRWRRTWRVRRWSVCVTTRTPSDCCSTARMGCRRPPCRVSL